jgi:hypothetical protein
MLVFGKIGREIWHEEEAIFCGADCGSVEAGGTGGVGGGGNSQGWNQRTDLLSTAFGVSATAQMAWTRFLIAEATESTPWITELVIDSLVRTRSSQTLPKEYISGDDIAHEILRIVTEENEHQIATIGKGPGDADVEFVPLQSQASENNVKRLFGSFKARG